MHLTVLSKLEMQVLFVVKSFTRHDGFWAEIIQDSSLRWEEIEQLNGMEHNVYRQKLWHPLKQKTVSSSSAPFLYHPDSIIDLWDVLVAASQVDHWATRHGLNQSREGCKFPIRMHRCDAKATMEVVLVYLLECLENLRDSSVREMVDRCEANLVTQCQEKRNLVNKENVD